MQDPPEQSSSSSPSSFNQNISEQPAQSSNQAGIVDSPPSPIPSTHPFTATKQYQTLSRIYKQQMYSHESLEQFKLKIEQARQTLCMFNMPNYSYPRSHHYHFYLDDFPRIEGQLSYALDNDNAFGLTYSKDQTLYYRGQVQSEILNRVAFTLPEKDNDKEAFPNHKETNINNQAQRLLFINENAKIELDRLLLTSKRILQRFEKLGNYESLREFAVIMKNGALQFLMDAELGSNEKKEMLASFIEGLEEGKSQKLASLQVNDYLYFNSSLQVKMHMAVDTEERIEQRIQRKMIQMYVNKHNTARTSIADPALAAFNTGLIAKLLFFYKSNTLAISETSLEKLFQYSSLKSPEKVRIPICIFDFGSVQLREKVNFFITHQISNSHVPTEDSIIENLARIFNSQFYLMEDEEFGMMSYQDSKALTMRVVPELKRSITANLDKQKDNLTLDSAINFERLAATSCQQIEEGCFPLFSHGQHTISVTEEEAKIVVYYHKICKAFKYLQPFIYQDNSLMEILCSPYFDTLVHGIVGNIPRKIIAKLPQYVKSFIQHSATVSIETIENQKDEGIYLELELNCETGLGLLWNPPRPQSFVAEEEAENIPESAPFNLAEEVPVSLLVMKPSLSQRLFNDPPKIVQPELQQIQEHPFTKRVKPNQENQTSK